MMRPGVPRGGWQSLAKRERLLPGLEPPEEHRLRAVERPKSRRCSWSHAAA
jgi:hypothetical protein